MNKINITCFCSASFDQSSKEAACFIGRLKERDGLLCCTPYDLYIMEQNPELGTVEQSIVYPKTIFGEFMAPEKILNAKGALDSSMTLKKAGGRFGRFTRPFFIIDNYPLEGTITIPSSGVPPKNAIRDKSGGFRGIR